MFARSSVVNWCSPLQNSKDPTNWIQAKETHYFISQQHCQQWWDLNKHLHKTCYAITMLKGLPQSLPLLQDCCLHSSPQHMISHQIPALLQSRHKRQWSREHPDKSIQLVWSHISLEAVLLITSMCKFTTSLQSKMNKQKYNWPRTPKISTPWGVRHTNSVFMWWSIHSTRSFGWSDQTDFCPAQLLKTVPFFWLEGPISSFGSLFMEYVDQH